MSKIFIIYPHGLGDCILLTPAIKALSLKGYNVSIATLKRFESAEFFQHNPYVDEIFYTKDAWNDYNDHKVGFKKVFEEWNTFAKNNSYNKVTMPFHRGPKNKTLINLETLGVVDADVHTEIYTSPNDIKIAEKLIKDIIGDGAFGFVQTKTGVARKDLPENYGRSWLKNNKGLDKVIELGKEINPLEHNINVQFEILRRASAVCLPDSVFYHACHAMDKEVDFMYLESIISNAKVIYERIKPLHKVKENVVFKL